jgi:hypothetical protein
MAWIRAGETELTREGLDEIGRAIDRIHARHRPGTSAFHESERGLAKTKRAGSEGSVMAKLAGPTRPRRRYDPFGYQSSSRTSMPVPSSFCLNAFRSLGGFPR